MGVLIRFLPFRNLEKLKFFEVPLIFLVISKNICYNKFAKVAVQSAEVSEHL